MLKVFKSVMYLHVSFQQVRPGKSLLTNVTFKWFLACMNKLVFTQGSLMSKRLGTDVTFVWLFSRVYQPMGSPLAPGGKMFVAVFTFMRFDA